MLKGPQLLARDVAQLAYDAGWRNYITLCEAVAVCSAESLRYPEADNTSPDGSPTNPDGSIDYGLWQINSLHFGKTLGGVMCSKESCLDPARNARMAHSLYQANHGWGPWAAYANGSYKQFLKGSVNGVRNMGLIHFDLPLR